MTTLLAVDDEPNVLEDLQSILPWTDLGINRFLTAKSGQSALRLFESEQIDILLTDVRMPGMDGLELIRRTRNSWPNVRAVVLSAHDEFPYVREALKLGVENYILKPVSPVELQETILSIQKDVNSPHATDTQQLVAMEAFRHNVLQRWVAGTIEQLELAERADLLGIDLEAERFALITATDDIRRSYEDRAHRAATFMFAIRDRLGSRDSTPFRAEVFLDSETRLACLVHSSGSDLSEEELCRFARLSLEDERVDASWHMSIGTTVTMPSDVRRSYETALLLSNTRFVWNDRQVVCPAMVPSLGENMLPQDEAALVRFRHASQSLHSEGCADVLAQQLERLRLFAPTEQFAHLLPFLLSLLQQMAASYDSADEELRRMIDEASQLAVYSSFSEFKTNVDQYTRSAIRLMSRRRDTMPKLVRRIIELLSHSFSEDLSLKTIAAQLNVNPSYLGQLLHTHTGELFHDYLTKVRMREARALLIGSDLKVSEIASRCGFSQQSYFNRVFKQSHGMTPVEYRRVSRSG
jgi:two-component system response regulator YesN